MVKISVVINTLNEEKNLGRAVASVKDFTDEIIVCDMYSEDKTAEIAKKLGAKVFFHKKTDYVEPARNFAIQQASGDWIFVLDADEEIPPGLAEKLKKIAKEDKFDYVSVPRKNIIFGKWIDHSRWWPDYNIRFFKRGAVSWSEVIHSVPETRGKGFDLPPIEGNAIIHYHYVSLDQYLERLNRYTTEHAKLLAKNGYKFSWKDLISKSTGEFLNRYFFGEGYKNGLHGLAMAGLQAFSELVLYLKVWQAEGFKEEMINVKEVIIKMKEAESEFHYWQADTLLKENGGFIQRVKRKFKIP